MIKRIISFCLLAVISAGITHAKETSNVHGGQHRTGPNGNQLLSGCTASKDITSLDINNVSTIILMNGDMWWDAVSGLNVARYEIPKGSGKTSLFAGAIWIGGVDASNNL